MPDIDLWADENEPEVSQVAAVYRLALPRTTERTTRRQVFVYVEVDKHNMVNVIERGTYWFGDDVAKRETQRDIMNWLVEWELAEWKSIGPEDSELFATERLTNAN